MNFTLIKNMICQGLSCLLAVGSGGFLLAGDQASRPAAQDVINVFISSGDNHFLGNSLAMDSEKSIYDGLEMIKTALGTKILYWRGMQEAAWALNNIVREDNLRSRTSLRWSRILINQHKLEPLIVSQARKLGMDVWGVSTLGDWGASADTPCFNDYPFAHESKLRVDHPEWIPIDKYGKRRQGGTIELAYPEARKALIDLHIQLFKDAGYKGILFLTYVENFSLRFEDEYGYSEPIVSEFKKRYGIDIRTEEFNRFASKYDWHRLRGEYVTAYLRELKTELNKLGGKLGVFMNPDRPEYPMTWATLPHTHPTIGAIYMDYLTWVREEIVDKLIVWGTSSTNSQRRTVEDLLWLTRGTSTSVGLLTSRVIDPKWHLLQERGVEIISALSEEKHFLLRGYIPEQTPSTLKTGNKFEQMRFLAQVVAGKSQGRAEDIIPLTTSKNIVLQRLALNALQVTGDPKALPTIEAALYSSETGVRCKAIAALSEINDSQSIVKLFDALDKKGNHPEWEMARSYIPRMTPFPKEKIMNIAKSHHNSELRNTALRILETHSTPDMADFYRDMLKDPVRYIRYTAAFNLAQIRNSPAAISLLLELLNSDSDMAVRNRAGISLGQMINRNDPAAVAIKTDILAGLEKAFRSYGDKFNPSDLDWGYRSLGEAFLYCGADGEAVLTRLMNNGSDERLADYSWRILSYREKVDHKANRFNLITPQENDRLYAQRPVLLKKQKIEHLNQDFENIKIFDEKTSGMVGLAKELGGRWGYFNPDKSSAISNATAYSGKQALLLFAGNRSMLGMFENILETDMDFDLEMMVRLDSGSTFSVAAGNISGLPIEFKIDKNGILILSSGQTERVDNNVMKIPGDQWVRLCISSDINNHSAKFTAMSADGSIQQMTIALKSISTIDRLVFSTSGSVIGTKVYVDDVKVVEKR